MRRPVPRATAETVSMPAPIGGWNSVDVGTAFPALDAVYLYNMLGQAHGLQSRQGYVDHCTDLTGAGDSYVRTMLSFVGSAKNGSGNKLFAVTSSGIVDVTDSTTAPAFAIEFPDTSGEAGYGTSCVMATAAGRFLLYCDEVNGLYVYTETSASWAKVAVGITQAWAAATVYAVGDSVVASSGGVSRAYTATVGGTSSSTAPSHTSGAVADGTVTWQYVSAAPTGVIGPSLADQQNDFTADPANFVAVVVWKSRAWFVERDTSRAWYLGVNSIFGTATSFDFGSRMRSGGPLVGLYDWSHNAGNGLDAFLVGISGAGDVVIYQGTDPTSSSTFGLTGSWSVGGLVSGRRIATDFGGDMLILSLLGAVPLSQIVRGADVNDAGIYATRKIGPLFNQLAASFKSYPGWSIHLHPTENALMITVPSLGPGNATQQLMMSFASKGWSLFRDLPMYSAVAWNGEMYFGTVDGRVCRVAGYVDDVPLAGTLWQPETEYVAGQRLFTSTGKIFRVDLGGITGTEEPETTGTDGTVEMTITDDEVGDFTAVDWSLMTAVRDLGTERVKQVVSIRPLLLADAPSVAWEGTARYGYNMLEPTEVSGNGGGGEGTWDASTWDSSVWGESVATSGQTGAHGEGREVAIALRGNAIAKTTLVKIGVTFRQGGLF